MPLAIKILPEEQPHKKAKKQGEAPHRKTVVPLAIEDEKEEPPPKKKKGETSVALAVAKKNAAKPVPTPKSTKKTLSKVAKAAVRAKEEEGTKKGGDLEKKQLAMQRRIVKKNPAFQKKKLKETPEPMAEPEPEIFEAKAKKAGSAKQRLKVRVQPV